MKCFAESLGVNSHQRLAAVTITLVILGVPSLCSHPSLSLPTLGETPHYSEHPRASHTPVHTACSPRCPSCPEAWPQGSSACGCAGRFLPTPPPHQTSASQPTVPLWLSWLSLLSGGVKRRPGIQPLHRGLRPGLTGQVPGPTLAPGRAAWPVSVWCIVGWSGGGVPPMIHEKKKDRSAVLLLTKPF